MKYYRYLLMGVALLFLSACHTTQQDNLLYDFESDKELDDFEWNCKTIFSLSTEHVTHGKQSLKLELFPSDYPGIAPLSVRKDWRDYRIFAFDVYNPSGNDLIMYIRVDDTTGYNDEAERINQKLFLKPGMNRLKIPLLSMRASRSHRLLDFGAIKNIILFMESPHEKITVYTDFWRLER